MNVRAVSRVLFDSYRTETLRARSRRWRANIERWGRLLRPENRHIAAVAAREHAGFLVGGVRLERAG